MTNITDIFFDLDHTLWDFDKNSKFAFDKIFKKHRVVIETEKFVEVYAPINQACWKLYQVDKITHEELRYSRLRQSFDALNYLISDELINLISMDYIAYLTDNNELFDGTIELLEYLSPNYNLHIITNGVADVQYKKLSKSGIENYFQTVTNSEKAGVKKPHRNIFEFALSLANTKKENAIMIGDCIEADVNGAMDFGMQAVLFDTGGIRIMEGIPTVKHLLELKKYYKMKKVLLFLIFLISLPVFSQTVNDYQYIVVPVRFADFSENDQYRMNTVTKIMLQKYGFKSFLATDSIPDEIANNNCKRLTADLVKNSNAFVTKLKVVLKDCKEKIVYETEFGTSREKSYMTAYNEALREAFKSFDKLNYKYNGKNGMLAGTTTVVVIDAVNSTETNVVTVTNSEEFYFAQPITNGFQIVNTEPRVIMKLYNTSDKNIFIGIKGTIQGVVILKNNQWFFEYYENSKLVSEPLNLKF